MSICVTSLPIGSLELSALENIADGLGVRPTALVLAILNAAQESLEIDTQGIGERLHHA